MIDTPGIYTLSMADYLADPCPAPSLNHSLADTLLRYSPAHCWRQHPRLNPLWRPVESEAFDLGRATHALLLEGREDLFAVIAARNWATKSARLSRAAARAAGQIPLLLDQMLLVRAMATAIREQARAYAEPRPFTAGRPEQTLIWQEGAIWCRARLDWIHFDARTVDDLKTTGDSAHPAEWGRACFNRGDPLQAAFHLRGLQRILGRAARDFRFVVAETAAPHAMSVIGLDPESLAFATEQLDTAIALFGRCLASDRWPGYPTRPCYVEVPPWVKTRWMERFYYEEATHADH